MNHRRSCECSKSGWRDIAIVANVDSLGTVLEILERHCISWKRVNYLGLPLDVSIDGIANGVATNAIGVGDVFGASVAVTRSRVSAVVAVIIVVAVVVVAQPVLSAYIIRCISD